MKQRDGGRKKKRWREGEKEGGKERKDGEGGREGRGILMSGWKASAHGYFVQTEPDELSTTAATISKMQQ